jgi:phage-related protein
MSVDVGSVKYKVELDDKDVDKQADQTEHKLLSKFGGAAKKVGAAALAASTAVASAATAAVVDLTKQAVSTYAEFEQLKGGAELMFGDAYDFISEKAQDAYKNVQMSQNEYLTQVNGLAVGLKTALNGDAQAAAELADKVVTAEADIVAATGNSQEAVQNAFNGIMKSNFSMLDNLQLGITPTKEGMQEVIDKVNEWNEANGRATKYQMGNLADMQSALVDYVEMQGMANYAANEGADTLAGSFAATKAAWENILTAIGDGNENALIKAIDGFVESASNAFDNLLPVVDDALHGIAQLAEQIIPEVAEKIPEIFDADTVKGLLNAGMHAISALAEGLLSALPDLFPVVMDIIMQLGQKIIEMAPEIVKCGIELLVQLAIGLAQALPELIPAAIDAILTIVDTLIDNVDLLIDGAIALIIGLAEGLIDALPRLIEKAPEIVLKLLDAIIRNAPKLAEAGAKLIMTLIEGIVNIWSKVFEVGRKTLDKVKDGFWENIAKAGTWGQDLIQNFIDGIMSKFESLKNSVKRCAQAVKDFLGFSEPEKGPLSDFHTYAPDMMNLYAKGIEDNIDTVEDSVNDVAKAVSGTFSADLGYNLPDIAGYAADLSAMITATSSTEIIVPLNVDGREIARASAWYMNEQLAWEAR